MTPTGSHGAPDVLVVGAGIVGTACAWHLASLGLDVEVIEGSGVGGGATAAGMGHLVVMDDSPEQLALTRWSLELWRQLRLELPADCEAHTYGTLWVAEDEADLQTLDHKAHLLRRHDLLCERLDGAALKRLEPCLRSGLPGALRVPGDAVVYPPRVASHLLRRAGLTPSLGTRVVQLEGGEAGRDAVALLADGSHRTAGWIVDATGHRALDLLPESLPGLHIIPRKGHLVITERVPGFCRHQLVEVGYAKSTQGHQEVSVAFNLQPRPNGQLLLGSSRQSGVTGHQVEDDIVQRMLRRAMDFVPDLERLQALRVWTGLRAATDDHLPLLGPLPGRPRLLLASGHEGLGITTALASAHLMADEILDRPSVIDRQPYRPDRFLREAA